jgi:O-antigen/teichoic acid export membrane protein
MTLRKLKYQPMVVSSRFNSVMPLKEFGYRLLSAFYEAIFKEKMSHEARKFFIGTSYVAIGTLFGALLTFIFNILAARILGPENFGNLGLITAVSAILAISMSISITPAVRYSSASQDRVIQTRIISTSYIQIGLFTGVSVIVYAIASQWLSAIFGISATLFLFSVVLAFTVTFFSLTMSSLKVLFRLRAFALLNAVQSVIVLAFFLALVNNNLKSWESAAYAMYIANVTIGIVLVIHLRDHIRPQFDRFCARRITRYSLLSAPGVIAGALLGLDRLLVNKFLTTADVGIYSAYFLPSITIATLLWGIINAAFFPYASRSGDRLAVFHNINKAAPYLAALLLPSIFLIQSVAFFFYGSRYHFNAEIALLFAIAATIFAINQSYSWLVASTGTIGAKVNTYGGSLALAVLIGFNVVLIPLIGISGAAITLIFTYLMPILFIFSKRSILSAS